MTQQTFQRCFNVVVRLIWRSDIGQRQNNVETTLEFKTLDRINVIYFYVDLHNVRQHRNNVVIFNVDFRNVGQRRNNVVNMAKEILYKKE